MDVSGLYALVEKMSGLDSIEGVEDICIEFSEMCELEYYLFGVCNAVSLSSPQLFTLTNYPPSWFDGYLENDFQKHDPVVRYCFENSLPITWSNLMKMDEYRTPEALQLMSNAKSFGLIDGLSVPIKAPSGEVSIISLSTKVEERHRERIDQVLPFAQYFGYSLFEVYMKFKLGNVKKVALTPREKESIFWACEGKTSWEMSQIMSVSERTAIFHLTSATKKLGAANRQHAVAKAIMYGLVKPLP